jgi:hypothetical protein
LDCLDFNAAEPVLIPHQAEVGILTSFTQCFSVASHPPLCLGKYRSKLEEMTWIGAEWSNEKPAHKKGPDDEVLYPYDVLLQSQPCVKATK